MTPLAFEQRYQEEWQELERLLDTLPTPAWRRAAADRPVPAVRLAALYRRACGHLALARARSYPADLIDRLDRLTARGHQIIYHRHEVGLRPLARIFTRDFPSAVRANAGYVAVAAAVFAVPALVLGLLVYWRSDLILSVVGSDQTARFEEMYSASAASIGRSRDARTDWMMFGFYIRNNIGISFQCFAAGLFFGLGSIFFLAFNGAFGGALAGYLTERGLAGTFWPFVATHSSFEVTAIVLSGAAGLKIGHALIAPRRATRRQALVRATRDSAPIIYGITAMLVVAAAIEAFWSSSRWVWPSVKFVAAAGCWTAVILYFVRQGRYRETGRAD